MMYFFFGWLVCLTVVTTVRSFDRTSSSGMTEVWKTSDKLQKSIQEDLDKLFSKKNKETAEFIHYPRTEEIMKHKKDVTLDDILL